MAKNSHNIIQGQKLAKYYLRPKSFSLTQLLNFVTLSLMGNKNERTSSYIVLFEFFNMMKDNS